MTVIRFIGDGKKHPAIKLDYSINNGLSWQHKDFVAGQSFPIPPNCTNLVLDNVPYDPKCNYEIRNGHVVQV